MSKYIEFPLEGGGAILIESPDEPSKAPTGLVPATRGESLKEMAEQARQSFDASVENVRKSADLLVNKLRALSDPPDEMEVSFSLKASGELGNIAIGKAGAEANYTVTLRWRKEEKKEEGSGKKEEEK
ncbi:MAG: uncharacterized protein HW418_2760 [Anaerolineales bacterium]|jgi:hypothetical protein|nr:uncharacterized protein [Anaerolineales bacterium]